MKKYILPVLALSAVAFTACENADKTFPDYEGGTSVYFAYQYPVRTIELGEDNEINTDLDNAHKFKIVSAMGGAYNGKNIQVQIKVDESLCENLYFANGAPVKPMPSSYYSLASTTLTYDNSFANSLMGQTEVQLTDAFFADPASITTTYVIPVVITGQSGADRILSGTPLVDGTNPSRVDSKKWDTAPMDYALWCVRYVNKWHGTYLVKEAGKEIDKTTKRVTVKTTGLNECTYTNVDGKTVTLQFSGDNCTVTGAGVSGNGEFKQKSEIKAWGNKDRDALYLKYTVDGKSYDETLVAQVRTTEGDPYNTVVEFAVEYK